MQMSDISSFVVIVIIQTHLFLITKMFVAWNNEKKAFLR